MGIVTVKLNPMTFMSIMQTIVTILHVCHTSFGMRMILIILKFELANYLQQMALCNSGKIVVTYYNMYLPTTDAAVQQYLWLVSTYCN